MVGTTPGHSAEHDILMDTWPMNDGRAMRGEGCRSGSLFAARSQGCLLSVLCLRTGVGKKLDMGLPVPRKRHGPGCPSLCNMGGPV